MSTSTAPPAAQKDSYRFEDATAASGIAYDIGYRNYLPLDEHSVQLEHSATGGAAAGDYDNDGDIDLFITRGDIGPNLLYRNNGLGVFTDVAASAGLAFTGSATENYRHSGPTFADMDGDADLDLFIGGIFGDPSFIYRNNGDGTFSDVTPGSGIDTIQAEHNVSAAFGDYDLDGDLDLFISHWGVERNYRDPGDTEHLWRNDTDGGTIRFTSVSESAGISAGILGGSIDSTFTPSFARIDGDRYPDILSVADFQKTRFFRNNGDGTFSNATNADVLTDQNGMGSAVGDYDNDGDLDWFVTSIMWPGDAESGNRLYRNDDGVFVNVTDSAGVRSGGWGWGACFLDFENDGDLDIYHTNGWTLQNRRDFEKDSSVALVSSGGGEFSNEASDLGLIDWEQGRGVVCADFDNDGDVDILQQHRGSPVAATLWRNNSNGSNYLKIKLLGHAPNTEAAGARIYVRVGDKTQMREIIIGSNFVSQNPTVQVVGLGSASLADEVRIEWPDGVVSVVTAVTAGQTLTLSQ